MMSSFQQLMGEAARLTRQGDLQAATAAIQQALGASPFGAAGPHTQHDVAVDGAASHRPASGSMVIDVDAREVPDGAPYMSDVPTSRAAGRPASAPPDAQSAVPGEGRVERGTFRCAAGQRDWRLYVPPGQTGQARPLVVMLHGCTQGADDFAAGTAMDQAAREQGVYVLYPEQTQRANSQRCWNWFKHNHQQRGKGEPALLAALTRNVMAHHAIDPRRVYVAGLSAGGAMAAILGETYPDLYAAVGVHSGLAAGAASDLPSALAAMKGGGVGGARAPKRAGGRMPTIVFHGDRDHTVHPVNGEHVVTACTVPGDGRAAACVTEETARTPKGRTYTRRVHTDAHGRPVAEHWVVHGAGHAWSGGSKQGSYTDVAGPDASAAMLRFFCLQSMPEGHGDDVASAVQPSGA